MGCDMNGAHLHLTVNDVPIIAAFTAGALLTIALVVRSHDTWVRAGLLALAVAVGGGLVAVLSGIAASDVIVGMPRTSNKALSQHHVRAIVASSFMALAGLVGLIVFLRARKRARAMGRGAIATILAATIVAAATLAWTGLAGGRINHPELQHRGDLDEGPARHH